MGGKEGAGAGGDPAPRREPCPLPRDVEPKGVHALVLAAPHQSYGTGTEN